MNLRSVKSLIIAGALIVTAAFAADQDDAAKSAKEILTLLQKQQYALLWDSQMSDVYRKTMTKDSFLANMTMGRAQLGPAGDSKFIDMAYSPTDPTTGGKAEIYSFNYLNAYAVGKFYERLVVIKDKDGRFRLAGLWGAPAPK